MYKYSVELRKIQEKSPLYAASPAPLAAYFPGLLVHFNLPTTIFKNIVFTFLKTGKIKFIHNYTNVISDAQLN